MNNSTSGYFEPLIAIALAASVLGWAWYEAGVVEPAPAVAEADVLAVPAEGSGHGSYCLIPEHGTYFYGDFDEKAGTFDQFADWCGQFGGDLGWIE